MQNERLYYDQLFEAIHTYDFEEGRGAYSRRMNQAEATLMNIICDWICKDNHFFQVYFKRNGSGYKIVAQTIVDYNENGCPEIDEMIVQLDPITVGKWITT
jgi:hypothetical protein